MEIEKGVFIRKTKGDVISVKTESEINTKFKQLFSLFVKA